MPSLKLVQERNAVHQKNIQEVMHYIRRIFKRSESSNFTHYYEKALNISDICKKINSQTLTQQFMEI